jgi:hypothetical protein
MRDEWYGDKRDLVKWGVLLELERRYGAKHILQVLYYRRSEWKLLEIDGDKVELNSAVLQHFRDPFSASKIACKSCVEVLRETFSDRDQYHNVVLQRIRQRTKHPRIIFLDPDTGLEPGGRATLNHVLESELGEIWNALRPRDVLVLYQHQTNRNGSEWIKTKKKQFERAIGIGKGESKIGRAGGIARDVAFFFVEKDSK